VQKEGAHLRGEGLEKKSEKAKVVEFPRERKEAAAAGAVEQT